MIHIKIGRTKTARTYLVTLFWILNFSVKLINAAGTHITFGFGISGYEFVVGVSNWEKGSQF